MEQLKQYLKKHSKSGWFDDSEDAEDDDYLKLKARWEKHDKPKRKPMKKMEKGIQYDYARKVEREDGT